jgi:hypothetical protein
LLSWFAQLLEAIFSCFAKIIWVASCFAKLLDMLCINLLHVLSSLF